MERDRERVFLVGLERLTRETGVAIGGCGCCGSPFLIDDADVSDERSGYSNNGYAGEVTWVTPSDEYAWENYSESIVKDTAHV